MNYKFLKLNFLLNNYVFFQLAFLNFNNKALSITLIFLYLGIIFAILYLKNIKNLVLIKIF